LRRVKPARRILNRPVVLLFEDEFLVHQTLVDILHQPEFWVVEEQDADEALELLRSRTDVAVVVTDVNMPGFMNGFEFARPIRVRTIWRRILLSVASPFARPPGSRLFGKS